MTSLSMVNHLTVYLHPKMATNLLKIRLVLVDFSKEYGNNGTNGNVQSLKIAEKVAAGMMYSATIDSVNAFCFEIKRV